MNLLQKIIFPYLAHTYVYETDQSIKELKAKMEYIVDQKSFLNRRYNLQGKVYPDNSFYFEQYIPYKQNTRGPLRIKPETIEGNLSRSNNRKTLITIVLRSNFMFALLSIIMLLVGISACIAFMFNHDKEIGSVGLGLFIFPIFFRFIQELKCGTKSEFEYAFDLPKNDDIVSSTL